MQEFEGMSEEQIRLFHLEAKILQMQCQIVALRQTILGYLNTKQVHFGQIPADTYYIQVQQKTLEDLLRALADFDPKRASMMSKILEGHKNS